MDQGRTLRGPARTWSIIVMSLLCAVLGTVLLRRPAPPVPPAARPPPTTRVPEDVARPLSQDERRAMYRAWPLFEGWPLPQLPPGSMDGPQPPPAPSRPSPARKK